MPIGFGNEPPEEGKLPRGMRADEPPPSQPDDLHAIRARYCGPKSLSIQNIALTANVAVRFDLTGTPINAIILTTATGQLNGYFGDYTSGSGKTAVTPHFVGSAGIAVNTEVLPIPPASDYIFTIQEGAGSTATGTIIFCYQ